MFESVIERQGLRAGRFGTGMWVSLGVHAGVLAAVLLLSGQSVQAPEEQPHMGPLMVQLPGPTLAKGSPAPARPAVTSKPKPRPRPRDKERVPRQVQPLPEVPPPPAPPEVADASPVVPEVGDSRDDTGVPGGHPDGDPHSTSVIGSLPVPGLTFLETGTDVVEFNTEMKRPQLLSGPALEYTPEALRAGVQGLLTARCIITREGQVRDCRVTKGLPYMSEAVVDALHARRYRPLEYQGRPVSVAYTFLLRLKLP